MSVKDYELSNLMEAWDIARGQIWSAITKNDCVIESGYSHLKQWKW